MAGRTFTVDIVTPDRVVLSDDATSLVAPGAVGSFGVLPNHAPMLSELTIGELRYRRETAEEIRLAISGGFLQVFKNEVTVLADSAERAEEIDVDRARQSLSAAEETVASARTSGVRADIEAAELALARAKNRLRVASG
jgi:F-type H+-transporting ATPase subunit epsilon